MSGLWAGQFMDFKIRELWPQIPRIAGPAFTVKCEPGDHLMLHAAIYAAPPGDVIVVEADENFAVAGGNVCAIAQKRGIAGFVVDGTIRDVREVREMRFPVFAKGVMAKPGAKKCYSELNQPVQCGGVTVSAGDVIIADEEGIAVVPHADAEQTFEIAQKRNRKDASMTLEQWQENHHRNVMDILRNLEK